MGTRFDINITMTVTRPQAIALRAMFDYWDWLGAVGSSRRVAFFVDGDGDFHPKCRISGGPEITKEHARLAIAEDEGGHRLYDYDPVAWDMTKKDSNNDC